MNPELSEAEELDVPVSISYTGKNKFPYDGWTKDQVLKMDSEKQVTVFLCATGENNSFAPIIGGVFDVNN